MAQGITPDGINPNARINPTTERKLYRKVVDNVLASRTYMARQMGMGKPFRGKTYDIPIKITDSGLGEFFAGLETLSSAASDTMIELSYAQTAFAQPVVSIMLESFANSGPEGSIDLDVFKLEEAVAESVQKLGTAAYSGTSASSEPLGLESHVDDGTTAGTIGGQSRTTYSGLNGTVTASGGTLTLAKLATLESAIVAAGIASEYPSLHLMDKTRWDLYERLLQPNIRAEYASIGFNSLPLRGDSVRSRGELKGHAGFTAMSYRGIPVIADDAATSGVWYMLNERYLGWRGRTSVPSKYAGQLEKVDVALGAVTEGVGAVQKPPSSAGWFFQKQQMMPNQAGMIGRFYVIGQVVGSQPRRQGKLTGITGV